MPNILYILDDKVDLESFAKYVKKKASPNLYICPLTVDSDLIKRAEKLLSGYGRVRVLNFVKKFNENAFLYRKRFIQFISDFSKGKNEKTINLRKYFAYEEGLSLWWLSLVRETSTFKKKSYHSLAKLITIDKFADEHDIDELYTDIQDDLLKRGIAGNRGKKKAVLEGLPRNNGMPEAGLFFVKTLGFLIFFCLKKIVFKFIYGWDLKKRLKYLAGSKFVFATYFPFADKELLKKNIFKNEYFGALHLTAEKLHRNRVSYIAIFHTNTGFNMKKVLLAKKINLWGQNVLIPEELISFGNIWKTFCGFIRISFRYFKIIPYLRKNFNFNYGKDLKIWDMFTFEWNYSFSGTYAASNILYYYMFSNVMQKISGDALVIYPAEFSGWEGALNIAGKKFNNIKTLGIQHSSLPLLMLTYFNAPCDLASENFREGFPMPDYLGTSGELPRRMFIENGWEAKKVFNIGAIRYQALAKFLKKEVNWKKREKRVVVTLTSIDEENRDVLLMLWQAFRDAKDISFIIKSHPLFDLKKFMRTIDFNMKNKRFIFDTLTPTRELLISSRAVIVAGSSASIDGAACQCPVVIPRLSCVADMNPLTGVNEKLVRYVDNKDELFNTVSSLVHSDYPPVDAGQFKTFVKDYFDIASHEDEYFKRLEKTLLCQKGRIGYA